MSVKVGNYKGHELGYDSQRKKFSSTIDELTLESDDQEKLEQMIEKYLKSKGVFPVKVLKFSNSVVKYGRVTSYDPSTKRGYFVDEAGCREKPWRFSDFYLDTAANRVIAEEITRKRKEQEQLSGEIQALGKKLEEPFDEFINKANKQ